MKRERLVKKYLPVHSYDMAGLEAWFAQMAAQGLHLVRADAERAFFRPGPPQTGVRYALEVTGPVDLDRERNEDYGQAGWDYVTTLRMSAAVSLYYVYRTEDPAVPALHTDPVIQSATVAKLIRRLRRTLVLLAVLAVLLFRRDLAALIAAPWSAPRFLILHTEQAALWLVLVVPYLLSLLLPTIRRLWGLGRVRRRLAAGIPLAPEPRRRRIPAALWSWGLLVLVAAALLGSLWLSRHQSRPLSGPEEWTFPHVTLEQALERASVTLESPHGKMLHPGNFRRSLLCPEQYSWSQWEESETPGRAREAGVSIRYYRTRSPVLASWLLRALEEEDRAYFQAYPQGKLSLNPNLSAYRDYREVPCPGLDRLLVLEYQFDGSLPTTCYLGQRGDQVFRLLCRGVPDPERCLKLLAEQLDGARPQP